MFKFSLHHLKLRNKLIFIYIVCVFIPIVLTNIMFYNVMTTKIKNQKKADAELAITQMKKNLASPLMMPQALPICIPLINR